MLDSQRVIFHGEEFHLSDKALFWKHQSVLLVADVHLGKAHHFQKEGLPVSSAIEHRNLDRLDALIAHWNPSKLLFLGDLFHARDNEMNARFAQWLEKNQTTRCSLISGNHDRYNGFSHPLMSIFDEHLISGIRLKHEPSQDPESPEICGHIHPAVRLRGKGRSALRLPALVIKGHQMIVPAFGEFTGTHVMELSEGDQVFPIT